MAWGALCVAALLVAGSARALESAGPLVVVVSSNPEAPFVRRLAAELSLFGYRVEVAARNSLDVDLSELLVRSGGAALIAVDQGKQTAEVIVAPGSAAPLRRERERLDPRRRADTNAAVLAERFRARLTELGIAPHASPPLAEPPSVVVRVPPAHLPPAEPERRLWLAAALGGTSGGLGWLPDAAVEIRAFPVRWLSTSAFGKLSPFAAEVRAAEGQADVRWLAGGVLIDAYPLRRDLVLKVGVGALLVSTEMSGSAAPPFDGEKDSVLVPAGLLETGAALRLGPRSLLELQGFVGSCAPRVGVHFGGRSVAAFGQPFLGASLGLAVGVF